MINNIIVKITAFHSDEQGEIMTDLIGGGLLGVAGIAMFSSLHDPIYEVFSAVADVIEEAGRRPNF